MNVAKSMDTPVLKTKNTHDFKIDGVLNEQLVVLSEFQTSIKVAVYLSSQSKGYFLSLSISCA